MIDCNLGAAQLTTLHIPFAPDELAERSKSVLVSRLNFIHHRLTNNSLIRRQIPLPSATAIHAPLRSHRPACRAARSQTNQPVLRVLRLSSDSCRARPHTTHLQPTS